MGNKESPWPPLKGLRPSAPSLPCHSLRHKQKQTVISARTLKFRKQSIFGVLTPTHPDLPASVCQHACISVMPFPRMLALESKNFDKEVDRGNWSCRSMIISSGTLRRALQMALGWQSRGSKWSRSFPVFQPSSFSLPS